MVLCDLGGIPSTGSPTNGERIRMLFAFAVVKKAKGDQPSLSISAISIIKTARRINRPFCTHLLPSNAVKQRAYAANKAREKVWSGEKGPAYANFYFAASEIFRRFPSWLYLYSRPSGVAWHS